MTSIEDILLALDDASDLLWQMCQHEEPGPLYNRLADAEQSINDAILVLKDRQ